MKTKIFSTISALLLLLPGVILSGQSLKGTYFSEYSPYRNNLNPAFMPRGGYFGIAGFDNIGVGVTSNLGLTSFLFPKGDGSLMTGLHPDVPAEVFLKALPAKPFLDLDVDTDILGIGFYTGKYSYWTIGLGVNVDAEISLDKNLFKFIKSGGTNDPQSYHLSGIGASANGFIEASLGYSHDFSHLVKGLRAGIKAKFLASAARASLNINKLDITMGSDKWMIQTDATGYLMGKGFDLAVTQNEEDTTPSFDLTLPELRDIRPAGYGAAFDLGVEYRLPINNFFDCIRFSAAVTDLGFVKYKKDVIEKVVSSGTFDYTGVNLDFGEDSKLDEEFSAIGDEFMALLNLHEEEMTHNKTMRVKPQLYIGAELPFLWNKMSFGVLYHAKFGYTKTRNELTLSLNARPSKSFNIGINYSMLNTFKTIGWLLEVTPRSGVNVILGSDYTFFSVSPQYIPINELNFNLRFGLSFALGNRFDEKAEMRKANKALKREQRSRY